jgi:predicted nucleic acid-binding protein
MGQYLIDTNVVSDYLSASFNSAGILFMDTVIDSIPQISVITQIELLCWKAKTIWKPALRTSLMIAKF